MPTGGSVRTVLLLALALVATGWVAIAQPTGDGSAASGQPTAGDIFGSAEDNTGRLLDQGRQIFRFDTFGDEDFWGDQLRLHEAIATLSPRQVLPVEVGRWNDGHGRDAPLIVSRAEG